MRPLQNVSVRHSISSALLCSASILSPLLFATCTYRSRSLVVCLSLLSRSSRHITSHHITVTFLIEVVKSG